MNEMKKVCFDSQIYQCLDWHSTSRSQSYTWESEWIPWINLSHTMIDDYYLRSNLVYFLNFTSRSHTNICLLSNVVWGGPTINSSDHCFLLVVSIPDAILPCTMFTERSKIGVVKPLQKNKTHRFSFDRMNYLHFILTFSSLF